MFQVSLAYILGSSAGRTIYIETLSQETNEQASINKNYVS